MSAKEMMSLPDQLRERAEYARMENDQTARSDAEYFEKAADEIERLQGAKHAALKLADERAIEANRLRQEMRDLLTFVNSVADCEQSDQQNIRQAKMLRERMKEK